MNAPVPVRLNPGTRSPAMRDFLDAQLRWEQYHASRMCGVHALAAGGFCFWLLLAIGTRLSEPLRLLLVASWGICLLATGYAIVMERVWSRRRERQIEELRRRSP
jgi:hypothetical protein